jgi:hypothetical protein
MVDAPLIPPHVAPADDDGEALSALLDAHHADGRRAAMALFVSLCERERKERRQRRAPAWKQKRDARRAEREARWQRFYRATGIT